MNKRLVILFLIFMVMISGCAASRSANPSPTILKGAVPQAPEAATGGAASDSMGRNIAAMPAAGPAQQAVASANTAALDKRLVLRNANLTVVVDDPAKAMTTVTRMAETMGGFVVVSNLYKTTAKNGQEFPEATITVRVPAEKLNDAMDQIKGLVKDPKKDVRAENVSGQDVTKEYTDLQSRLTNLQDAEQQLREIMGSATKTEDVMAVYNQLIQIREQIEVTKGQIQYYEESAALSSISVLIQAQAAVQPLELGGWQPVGVARDALQALIDTMQFLGSAAIWLLIFVLPIGLVALAIFLVLRLLWGAIRRNRKGGKPSAPAAPAPPAN